MLTLPRVSVGPWLRSKSHKTTPGFRWHHNYWVPRLRTLASYLATNQNSYDLSWLPLIATCHRLKSPLELSHRPDWCGKAHPDCTLHLLLAAQIQRGCQQEDHLASCSAGLPLATKPICPVAAADSSPAFPSYHHGPGTSGSQQDRTTEALHLVD